MYLYGEQERTPFDVFAPYVDDTKPVREKLHLLYQLAFLERHQGVEQADEQILMLAKYLLEGQIGLGIEILFHALYVLF